MQRWDYFSPGVAEFFLLVLMLLVGVLLGNLVTLVLTLASGAEIAEKYSMIISYPVMFLPAMIYAGIASGVRGNTRPGYRMDNNHFQPVGGLSCVILAIVLTVATGYVSEYFTTLLPKMPEWLEEALKGLTQGDLLMNFISVSIFAPIFEEWLCRGMVLRGFLTRTKMPPVLAIILSALFFAIIHANPWQAIGAFTLGCVFGIVYYRTGSLKLTMLMHFTNNTLALALSQVDSLKDMESWRDVLPEKPYWIIYAACVIIIILGIRRILKIEMISKRGNIDPVPSLFDSEEN